MVSEVVEQPHAPEYVDGDSASLNLKDGGRLTIERRTRVAHYCVPEPLTEHELVHPYLAPVAAVAAHWLGRLSFHAGAFVSDGGVWGVVGDREAGKSSMLAWLALAGHDVFADDVLVLDRDIAYAGPRSVDLRAESAERLRVGVDLGTVGARERWRVNLPQVPATLPFRGWIFLEWGERTDATRLSGSTCLEQLMRCLTLRVPASDPAQLLALATRPAWRLARPKDWSVLDDVTEKLLSLTRPS